MGVGRWKGKELKVTDLQGSANSEAGCWLGHCTALRLSRDWNDEEERDQVPGADRCRGMARRSVGDDEGEKML